MTSELAESPDVLAHVAWDETKVSRDRYDDVLKCGQPERGLAYPRGLWLPGKIMTDVAESTCVYKLPADHNDFVEIFLMDGGINMDQSCRLIRQAMRHDGQLLSAEIGRFPKGSVLK